MSRAEFLRILARHKLVALVTAAVVMAAGALFLALQPRVYEATASVAVLPGNRLDQTLGAYDVVVARLLPQYASIVRSQTFLDQVAEAVPGAGDGRRLRSKVFARPDTTAAVLVLVAHDESPQRATSLARATLQQFLSQAPGSGIVDLRVIDQPRTPRSPVLPRRALVLGALPLVAVFLACVVAIAWNRLFGRIRDPDELRAASGRRVLGVLPYRRRLRHPLFVGNPDMTALDDGIRGIRTSLLLLRPSRPAPVVVTVTSLRPGDGKSTLAANLAVVAAEVGLRVLVMDVDARQPRQHEIFGLPDDDGLMPVLELGEDIGTAVRPTAIPRVSVLTLTEQRQSRSTSVKLYLHAVSRLRESADLVIVDGPSLSSDADLGLLAAVTDGVILLVRAGTAPAQLERALKGLDAVGVPVLGLVLTMSSAATRIVPYGAGPGPDMEPQATQGAWWNRGHLLSVTDRDTGPDERPTRPRHDSAARDGRRPDAAAEPDKPAPAGSLERSAAGPKGTQPPPGDRSKGPAAPRRRSPP